MGSTVSMPVVNPGVKAHPAWFGAVMSTGILACILYLEAELVSWTWLTQLAAGLLVLTSGLSVLLLIPYVRRLRERGPLLVEIADPVRGPLLATFPAGLVILAAAWGTVGPEIVSADVAISIDAVLLVVGALLAVGFSVLWNASPLRGIQGLQGVNGSWLIPPTSLALAPIALGPVMEAYPDHAGLLLLIGVLFFGAGLVMALALFALLVARLLLHPTLPSALAPSMWVPLAPGGVLGIAAMRLAWSGESAGIIGQGAVYGAAVFACAGVGFALWWALFATIDLLRMRRVERIPFQPGWWAFLFPPSAVVLSFLWIQFIFDVAGLTLITAVVVAALLVLWVVVLVRSIPIIRDAFQ